MCVLQFLYSFIHVSLYLDFIIFILLALLQMCSITIFLYSDIRAFIPLYFNDKMSITAEQWRELGFISFKTMSTKDLDYTCATLHEPVE